MEDNQEPDPKANASKRSTALAAVLLAVLVSPLFLLLHKRPAAIPEADDGFRPIAQFSGREHDVPHVKLELPAEIPKPLPAPPPAPRKPAAPRPASRPSEPTAALASVITLPAWVAEAAKPAPPTPQVVAAPRETPRRAAVPTRKMAAAKPKRAPRRPIAKIPSAPPKPALAASAPAAQPDQERPPASSNVRGRRALPPPELSMAEQLPPDQPDIVIGQTKGTDAAPVPDAAPRTSDGPAITIEHVTKDEPLPEAQRIPAP